MSFGGFDASSLLTVFILIFLSVFLFSVIKGIVRWIKNNHSPRLTVPAAMITKRMRISSHTHNSGTRHSTNSTTYYATFEVENGDRMEFRVKGREYGMLADGDVGMLSFQGTRYLGFERQPASATGEQ